MCRIRISSHFDITLPQSPPQRIWVFSGWPSFSISMQSLWKGAPLWRFWVSLLMVGRAANFQCVYVIFVKTYVNISRVYEKRLSKSLLLHPKVKNESPSSSTCWEGGGRISVVRTPFLHNLNAVLKRRAMSVKSATQQLSRSVKCREENGTSSSTQLISSHFIDIVIGTESTCIRCQTVGLHQFQRSHPN
jgi:hypothetical protein